MSRRSPTAPQRHSELGQFFDLSLDLFCIAGFDGYFKLVSPSFERVLGYSTEDLMSRPFLDITHPDDHARSREALADLAQGRDIVGFETRLIRADGSLRWFEWNTQAMPERGYVYGVARDVTERRRAEAELREAQRMLEASRDELCVLADEQAALRRVATMVARETPPDAVFAAVAREVGEVLGVDATHLGRYDADGTVVSVAHWGAYAGVPIGARYPLDGASVSAQVLRTGRPARVDDYEHASGVIAATVREIGIRFSIGAPISVEGRPWGVMIATSKGAKPFPAETESRLQAFTELVATAVSNTEARSELAASRARIIAAADEERRRVVRDLHDGAQQRLVQTVLTLKLARQALEQDVEDASALVIEAIDQAELATSELRELAQGILPGVLTHGGLSAAVRSLVSRVPIPVDIDVSVGRLPAPVEATAYFVVAEALTNVTKHAHARSAAVAARSEGDTLQVEVRDDGVGGAWIEGSGLVGLRDRLATLDGRLHVQSPGGRGTLITAVIPIPQSPLESA